MLGMESYIAECGLERSLLELVRIRSSQINGCAYCLDMHSKDARANGETEQRIYALSAWRESPFYTDREQAALAYTEAATLVSQGHIGDEVYNLVREQFSEKELADLALAVVTINSWNRLALTYRPVPGSYQPEKH